MWPIRTVLGEDGSEDARRGQLIKNDVNQGILPSRKQGVESQLLDVIPPAPMLPKDPSPTSPKHPCKTRGPCDKVEREITYEIEPKSASHEYHANPQVTGRLDFH